MLKNALRDFAKQVVEAHDERLAKFTKGISEGAYLHTLQWQTADVAYVIHLKAKADRLAYIAENLEGVEMVAEMRRLHEHLTRSLISHSGGHHSTNPVSNELEQQEVHATGTVLEKLDELLRYDEEVRHATFDAKVKALNVIALDPKIAKWLKRNDPKALDQVNTARSL